MHFSLRAENSSTDSQSPPDEGHLSASWEIAVVVALFVLLVGIIGTVIWHSRRTRRRHMRAQLLDTQAAGGETRERTPPPPPEFSRDVSLSKPPPVASAPSTTMSFDSESNHPPRYYWDHR
ncbi:hypothetical protein C8R44DRAFT_868293 [Mycena epipterygia]|nr:hypothetical protein C8R44DRAFT_868293 [Mycena epipterygia]